MTAVTARPYAGDEVADMRPWFPGWRPLATPVLAWALSRVLSLAVIAIANHLREEGDRVVDVLHRWDGNWYLEAAGGYGYPDLTAVDIGQIDIAFFPLFPLLIRATGTVTGLSLVHAGIFVTAVSGVLSIVAIWLLVHRVSGAAVADRAAVLVAFFPGSVALTLLYSEGVMMAAAAAALLALLQRRWVLAGVLGAVASATRPNGIAVALACAVAAAFAMRDRRDWRALAAPVIAPMGMVGYLVWLWAWTGSADVWFRVQREGWGERIDFGRSTMRDLRLYARLPDDLDFLDIPFIFHMRVVGLVFLVAAVVLMVRWRPPAVLWAYSIGVMAPSLLSYTLGARPRFIFTAFPLVVALAWQVRGQAFSLLVASSAVLLAAATLIYTTPAVVAP
ncbi:MAG: DUF2029 domain-containing protein [Nitriliruptorales bacterium]|nr:DUF2029 domain-containing protein [Nitriliruptorales bacterium]